ncbi:hypothetical protein NE237_024385 [Protea cynaroides]|uniref:Uncharacterized protein n=1 Tax=Protea cynaroides TaxID=273540 RepID=A0A9Q0HD73_9MAGN|nr:hypothetical protein NE237_024385 [Protea cynaroides]
MASTKGSKVSKDHLQWQKIFNALVHMLQTQQIQLESLVKERSLLQDRIRIQHDRWISDVHILEENISQMKMDISQAGLFRLVEAAKSDLMVGLKHREVFLCKLKLGHAETDLKDVKLWVDCLTHKCSEKKEGSQLKIKGTDKGKEGRGDEYSKQEEQRSSNVVDGESRKLKHAQEKLTSENNPEVSALLAERNFLWNQFKKMENDYNSFIKSKQIEVHQANQNIEKLLASMEELQLSNIEKDETILMLRTDLAKLVADMEHSNKENTRLSSEIESLRNLQSASVTPVLNRCMVEPSTCSLRPNNTSKDRRLPVKKNSAGSHSLDSMKESEEGCRKSSKIRHVEAISTPETPRLFSSTFKVPKLKRPRFG